MNRFFRPLIFLVLILISALPWRLTGQALEISEDLIESMSENEGITPEDLPQINEPIDINSTEIQFLSSAGLINSVQESALGLYISVNGKLISLYELQAVPFFDMKTIRGILPFIEIADDHMSHRKLHTSISTGKNQLLLRMRHTVQRQKGFYPDGAYAGSRQGFFIRFLHTGKALSFGLVAEKDPGEPWIDREHKQLLDFNSFHIRLVDPTPVIKEVLVGDFHASFGTGLIMNSSFRSGKSALTTNIYTTGTPIRPLRSAREYDFLRGIGISLRPHPNIMLHLVGSRRKVDATTRKEVVILGSDTIQTQSISNLSASGLHRTASEQSRKNSTTSYLAGLSASADLGRLTIQTHLLYQSTTLPLIKTNGLRYGRSTVNNSLNLRYLLRNVLLFGEIAFDQQFRPAMICGAIMPFTKSFDLAVQFRHLHPDYEHRGARTFAENTSAENETGLYVGLEFSPFKILRINAYADFWRHPKARFGIDFPGTGHEQLLRVTLARRKKFELYAQWRSETKDYNADATDNTRIPQLTQRTRQYVRIHYARKVSRDIELRNRVEFSRFRLGNSQYKKGFLITQDFLYKPLGNPFSLTARFAYFDTDSYDTRIYAYENDLSYQFSIPAYSGNGTRFYLNFKYKGIRRTTIEFRIAHTQMFDRNTIGSGNDQIDGSEKTDVKVQVAYRF